MPQFTHLGHQDFNLANICLRASKCSDWAHCRHETCRSSQLSCVMAPAGCDCFTSWWQKRSGRKAPTEKGWCGWSSLGKTMQRRLLWWCRYTECGYTLTHGIILGVTHQDHSCRPLIDAHRWIFMRNSVRVRISVRCGPWGISPRKPPIHLWPYHAVINSLRKAVRRSLCSR